MSDSKYVLLSIQPEYATKIFDGSKKVELRRRFPRTYLHKAVIIYVTTPVQAIVGGFQISQIVCAEPETIWEMAGTVAGVTQEQFDRYYEGAESGCAIFIDHVWRYREPIPLSTLRNQLTNFTPPQSFRYICRSYADSLSTI